MHPSPLNNPSRRTFLMQSAAALGLPLVAPQILAKPVAGANEKLNLAWVGFGNQGGGDLVWEARTLRELAARKGLVTQMGNQGHAFEGAILIKEWYQAGLIGDVFLFKIALSDAERRQLETFIAQSLVGDRTGP